MACTSEFGLSPSATEYTEKQKKLIAECDCVISQEGIEIYINVSATSIGSPCAVDVEHDEAGNMVGIGIYDGIKAYYYTQLDDLKWFLEGEYTEFVMHNGVSDIECLRMWGINFKDEQLVWDTLLLGHLLDSSLKSYGLKDMAARELGVSYPSYDAIVGKRGLKAERITLDKQPLELVSKYNALDCYVTYRLYERQKKACENL